MYRRKSSVKEVLLKFILHTPKTGSDVFLLLTVIIAIIGIALGVVSIQNSESMLSAYIIWAIFAGLVFQLLAFYYILLNQEALINIKEHELKKEQNTEE